MQLERVKLEKDFAEKQSRRLEEKNESLKKAVDEANASLQEALDEKEALRASNERLRRTVRSGFQPAIV